MRLIDADFTVYAAESEFDEEDAAKIRWLISHIPTVNAEPVRHGKWVFGGDGCVICSVCKEEVPNYIHRNYCPHCGAKMDLKD